MIAFYLHPRLLDRDLGAVLEVRKVPTRTVHDWIYSKSLISKWLIFDKSLTTQDVLSNVPSKFQDVHVDRHTMSMGTPFEISMDHVKMCYCEERASKGKKHVAYNPKDKGSG